MMPFTARNPLSTGDSNHRSSRSAALIVNSRVMSATVCASISLRSIQPSWATSLMSFGSREPTVGGVCHSIGDRIAPMRPIHSSYAKYVSASRFENRPIDSRVLSSSSWRTIDPSGSGRYPRPCGKIL